MPTIKLQSESLKTAITKVKTTLDLKASQPALTRAKVDFKKDSSYISITTFNLTAETTCNVDAEVESSQGFSFLVDVIQLEKIIKHLDGELTLSFEKVDEGQLHVESLRAKFQVSIADSLEYISFDRLRDGNEAVTEGTLNVSELVKVFMPNLAIIENAPNEVLKNVLIVSEDSRSTIYSTDGCRLLRTHLEHPLFEQNRVILARDVCQALVAIFKKSENVETEIINSKIAIFKEDNIQYSFRLSEVRFPDCEKLMEGAKSTVQDNNTIIVDPEEFYLSSTVAASVALSKPILVSVRTEEDELLISHKSKDGESSMPMDYETNETEVNIDATFLNFDYLSIIKTCDSELNITVASNKQPLYFSCFNWDYLLMPVNIQR